METRRLLVESHRVRSGVLVVAPFFACILLAQVVPAMAFTVSSSSPAYADLNQTLTCTITGTGFTTTPTAVNLQMSGQPNIVGTSLSRVNSSHITATFSIPSSAATGAWTVSVTMGTTVTKSGIFTVYAAPIATSITPNSGVNTGSVSITNLAGSNFRTGDTVALMQTGQTTITATGVTIVSSSQITCTLDLTGAATGSWDVVVTDPSGFAGTITGGFTVIVPPVPSVTSITPTTGVAGSNVNLTINGSNFSTDDFAELEKTGEYGTGSTITSVTPTQIQCTIALPNTDAGDIGLWDVRVWNSLQQGSTLPAAFNVTAPPAPTVTSISQTTGTQGGYYYPVTVTGTNFIYADTVVLRKAGQADIPFGSESWLGSTQFTFSLSIPSTGALGGYWNVVVTDPFGQTGTLANAFLIPIPAPPVLTSVSPTSASNGLTSVALTLTGSSFYNGDGVSVTQHGGGVSLPVLSGPTVSSLTKITLSVNPQGAPVGAYDVSVTDGYTQTSTLQSAFSLTAPAPISLSSITPSYETNQPELSVAPIRVYGSGIQTGATITFTLSPSGSPITNVGTVSVSASPNYIQCAPYFFYAGPPYGTQSPVGAYTVTVTNPDGGFATISPFNVVTYANPVPTAISPNVVPNTGVAHVTITGTGFFVPPGPGAPMTVIFSNPSMDDTNGMYGTNVNVTSSTSLTCDVDVTGKGYGLANPWDVQVCPPNDANPSNKSSGGGVTGGGILAKSFSVTNSTPLTVTGLSPNHGSTQSNTSCAITGTGFLGVVGLNNPGLIVQLVQPGSGAVIPSNGNYYVSSTSVTTTFLTTTAGLPLGLYDLHFTNSDGSTATLPGCFTLYASATPIVSYINPSTGPNTGPINITTLLGTGFVTGSTPKLSHSGQPDIVGTNVVIVDSGHMTCTFNLGGVLAGAWDVTVTQTDGNSGTRAGAFTVTEVAPTVTAITPNTGPNTGPVSITNLAGTNFYAGDTVTLQKSGQPSITATSVNAVSTTQITCTFDLTGAALGAWDVVVTDISGGSGTLAGGFTIVAGPPPNSPPTVTAITPNTGTNTGPINITNLAGTGFLIGASAKLSKTGQTDIAATGVTVVSPTQITCTFDLTGAATGAWDVTVTNTDTQSGTLPGGFTVTNSAPTVTAITPNSGLNTGPVSITNLAGTGFLTGATAKLSKTGQPDIAATGLTVVSPTKITCTFGLTGAASGAWDVVVTNTDAQAGTLPGGFTITNPAPTVTAITPNTGLNSGPVNITNLAGTGFLSGATVKLAKGATTITATGVTVVSPTKITCTFDLTGAAAGAWDVTVTNADTQSATLPGGFTIGNPAPTVTAITPSSGITGSSVGVTNLAGTGFLTGATVKLSKTGQTAIAATGVTVVSPTQITCTFGLTAAVAGAWDVVVTNTDAQSGTLAGGFLVDPVAPTMNALPTYTIGSSLTCSWTGLGAGVTHSRVQCSTDPAFGTVLKDSGWLAVPTTSYTFTGLPLNAQYYYRAQVSAQSGGSTAASLWSNTVTSIQTPAGCLLTYTGDTVGAVGSSSTLKAKLTAGTTAGGYPIAGNTVQFSVAGYSASAVTGATGEASVVVPASRFTTAKSWPITCNSLAGQGYPAASATATLVIKQGIINGSGTLLRNGKSCTIAFSFLKSTGTGNVTYYDFLNTPSTTILANGAMSIALSPDGHTVTLSGPCTVNGVATTFTLQATDTTKTVSLTAASGYSVGPVVLTSGTITIN